MAVTKKRTRRDKAASREQILEKTLKLISKVGWSEASFQAIAKSCGMSTSNVVYHFGSREELLKALLDYISQSNWEKVASATKPEDNAFRRLLVHMQKNIEWAQESPEKAQILLQIYVNASTAQDFAKVYQLMIERAHARILEHVLAGRREKIFRTPVADEVLVKLLHDWIVGAFVKVMASRLTKPFKYPMKEWEAVVGNLLDYREPS